MTAIVGKGNTFKVGVVVAITLAGLCVIPCESGTIVAWGNNSSGQCSVPEGLSNVVDIAAGGAHSLAVRSDGTVSAWGANNYGQCNVPSSLSNAVAVAAGEWHSLALRSDGTVVAWGRNDYGQANVPAGLSNVIAIAAGGLFSVALRSNGTVVAWGRNTYGECNVPANLSNVVSISSRDLDSLALKSDGTVVAWGANWWGEGDVPSGLSNVIEVSSGFHHCLALRADHTIVGWGGVNQYGERSVPTSAVPAAHIVAGCFFSGVVKGDSSVMCWGRNIYGETNVPPNLSNVVKLAAGYYHVLALVDPSVPRPDVTPPTVVSCTNLIFVASETTGVEAVFSLVAVDDQDPDPVVISYPASGSVFPLGTTTVTVVAWDASGNTNTCQFSVIVRPRIVLWGANQSGQCNLTTMWPDLVDVAGGGYHTLGLRADGTVTAWGNNDYGQCNVPSGLTGVVEISAGRYHSLALCSNGNVVAWGADYTGQSTVPANLRDVVAITAGGFHNLALKKDGTVVAWGNNTSGQCNVPPDLGHVIAVAAGAYHSIALRADGTVREWGEVSTNVPQGLTNIVAIDAGDDFSVALRADGIAFVWGRNIVMQNLPWIFSNVVQVAAGASSVLIRRNTGELSFHGYGVGQQNIPGGLENVACIRAGDLHCAAIQLPDSSRDKSAPIIVGVSTELVVTANALGTHVTRLLRVFDDTDPSPAVAYEPTPGSFLPMGTSLVTVTTYDAFGKTNAVQFPVVVRPATVVAWGNFPTNVPDAHAPYISIAAGHGFSLGLLQDGTVKGWGAISDHDFNYRHAPVFELAGFQSVAAGYYHGLALKTNGTVVAFGNNDWGQCNVPQGLDGVVAVAAGRLYSLALCSDGSVVAWGYTNRFDTVCNVPLTATGVVSIALGADHALALRSDGNVVAWGYNGDGQCNVPPDLTNVVAVAAGWHHSTALKSDGTIVAWGRFYTNVPPDLTSVVAIAVSSNVNLALKSDGTVVAWGGTSYVPAELSNVVAIAAGGYHSLALIGEPPARTFVIAGRIVHGGTGQGVDGAVVTVEGIGSVLTTNGGYYQVEVPEGWSGEVEVSYGAAVFSLGTQSYVNVTNDLTGEDYSFTWGGREAGWVTDAWIGEDGRVRVNWGTETGLYYDVYWSEGPVRGGMEWQRLASGLAGDGTEKSLEGEEVGSTNEVERYFTVVLAGEAPSEEKIYGLMRKVMKPGYRLLSAPLRVEDRRFDGGLGMGLASVLDGAAGGGSAGADEVFVLEATGWRSLYLDGEGVWREADGSVSMYELPEGAGLLVWKKGMETKWLEVSGRVGNDGTRTNVLRQGWNLIGLSEGRDLKISEVFEGVAQGGATEETADQLILQTDDGRWRRLMYVEGWGAPYDGKWFDLSTYQVVSTNEVLRPGQAYYYLRRGETVEVRF